MPDKELDNIEKWLAESFESFLMEDPTRLTAASPKLAANYAVARFENLLSTSQREAEIQAKIEILAKILVQHATGKKRIGLDRAGVVSTLAMLQIKREEIWNANLKAKEV